MDKQLLTKEKTALIDHVKSRLLNKYPSVSYAKIVDEPLPRELLIFFRWYAEQTFRKEKPIRIVSTRRFDFSHPHLRTEIKALKSRLLDHFCLSTTEFETVIAKGISLAYDMIARPSRAIPVLLFHEQKQARRAEILELLQQLNQELPYIHSLIEYFSMETAEAFSVQHFEEILAELQKQIYSENPIPSLLMEINALGHFYEQMTSQKKEKFPVALFYEMLQDRDLQAFAASLLQEAPSEALWTIEQMQHFLERYMLVGQFEAREETAGKVVYTEQSSIEDFKLDPPEDTELNLQTESYLESPEDESEPERVELKRTSEPIMDMDEEEEKEPMSLLNHDFPGNGKNNDVQKEQSKEFDSPNLPASKPENGVPSHFAKDRRKPFSSTSPNMIIHREEIEKQPPGPFPSLYTFIDFKSRKVFIKKIFSNDESAFENFVEKIDRANSWKEAKAIFDAELSRRSISPYSRYAIKLSDFLFSRYFSKNRY